MKRWPNPAYVWRITLVLAAALLLAGCARFPDGAAPVTLRGLSFTIIFNGPVDDNLFYFVPIDISGTGEGPVPVFPGITTGQGWVTGSATHYIQYHQRQYTVFRIISLDPFQSEAIGAPARFTLPSTGSSTLSFTIELDAIGAVGPSVDANIIAVDQPFAEIRLLDALGPLGTDFLNIDITTDRTITNSDLGSIEPSGDVLDQNRSPQPVNEQTVPLDIVDFSIAVDV